jgi:hypothetical protein
VKYKISLALGLLTSAITLQASNPLTYLQSKTESSIASKKSSPIVDSMAGAGWAIAQQHNPLNKKYYIPVEKLIQEGRFNNALYIRTLLAEFYCGRCAVAASGFTNSTNLAIFTNKTTSTSAGNTWPANTSATGDMRPGGLNIDLMNTFVTTAQSNANKLQTARTAMEGASNFYYEGTQVTPSNPLENFKGIFLVPDATFSSLVGDIIIDGNIYGGTDPAPIFIKAGSLSGNSVTANANITLKTGIKPAANLILTAWPPGKKFNNKNFPTLFKSITGTLLGGPIAPIYIFQPQFNAFAKEFTPFFQKAPNNPWAFVVTLNATTTKSTGKTVIAPHASLLAMVQLNPLDYPPPVASTIKTLNSMPSNLYNLTENPKTYLNFSTNRFLRGIVNGYLSSWEYKQIIKPSSDVGLETMQAFYPTPTAKEFAQNNRNTMYYALYATHQALGKIHLTKKAFSSSKNILSIINNPDKPAPGHIGQYPLAGYQPVYKFPQLKATAPQSTAPTPQQTKTAWKIAPKNKMRKLLTKLMRPFNKIFNKENV